MAKFVVKRVTPSEQRPHGLHYSLTLHNEQGERLLGFDNTHADKTGRAKSNLSRTLKTMESYGLVQFEEGHGRNRAPRVHYTDLLLDVPLQAL